MNGFLALGLFFAAAGGVSIYLASPNQRWRAAPWLVSGLFALLRVLQAPAAAFVFVHWLMLLFILFPYLGALLAARRER